LHKNYKINKILVHQSSSI